MSAVDQVLAFIKESGWTVPYLFPYGSRLYGTITDKSDYDYIGVSLIEDEVGHYKVSSNVDLTVYYIEDFVDMIGNHEISAVECVWCDNLIEGKKNIFHFDLNTQKLRHSISNKVSHCWVKGKKKITVGSQPPRDDDYYIGIKSIFHAFRIVDFGIQIANFGEIRNYGSANKYWEWLVDFKGSWEELEKEFKSKLNTRMSEFRILCPKIVIDENV